MFVLDQDGHVRDRLEEELQLELRKFINIDVNACDAIE